MIYVHKWYNMHIKQSYSIYYSFGRYIAVQKVIHFLMSLFFALFSSKMKDILLSVISFKKKNTYPILFTGVYLQIFIDFNFVCMLGPPNS